MDKTQYSLEMRCDRCTDQYGWHYVTKNGLSEGCAIADCYCTMFLANKEEQDRITMRNMLEEVSEILRDVRVGIPVADSAYTRLGVALVLVRDTQVMLTPISANNDDDDEDDDS